MSFSLTVMCISLTINLVFWEDVSIRDPIFYKLTLDYLISILNCVCVCSLSQTCIIKIIYDHFKATVTIDLRKCVRLRCVLHNVHGGEQKCLDWNIFQIIYCSEQSMAETGTVYSHRRLWMNAVYHAEQMDVKWGGTRASVWLGQNEEMCTWNVHEGDTSYFQLDWIILGRCEWHWHLLSGYDAS